MVEGRRTEKKVYSAWLPLFFPCLRRVDAIEAIADDRFYVVSGNGYPGYLQRISDAVRDIATGSHGFTHLLIAVDAEEESARDRNDEIVARLRRDNCSVPSVVVVRNRCIETWFLGNRRIVRAVPQSSELREFVSYYDVRALDPEDMPRHGDYLTHAQFHVEYLRAVFRERKLAYTKERPGAVCESSYLDELVLRAAVGHMGSFQVFLNEMRSLGGAL